MRFSPRIRLTMQRHLVSGLLALLTVAVAATVILLPAVAQPPDYHRFADDRAWLGVPNFLNVVSNAPFFLVAVLGVRALWCPEGGARGAAFYRAPYALLFLALAAISLGSAYYHLAPDNARLVWDRLPMSVAFAAFVAAVAAERWNPMAGRWLLAPLVATGVGTVLWWRLSAGWSAENVLPYFAFQGWAFLVVLLMMAMPPGLRRGSCVKAVLVLYGAALGAELFDRTIFAFGQVVSGHTLKHLLAALAVYQVVRMLRAGDGR
jgi:hypothetical protein